MKKFIYTTLIALFFTISISYAPPCTVDLSSGLVAYYPFNGNADDASGNGNNGTVNGATLTTDRFGNANSAYDFNGINNYIQVDNYYQFNNIQYYTLSYWYLMRSNNYWEVHISKVYDLQAESFGTGMYVDNISQFNTTDNNPHLQKYYTDLPTNVWIHIAATYDGNNMNIYVNGNLVSTQITTGNLTFDTHPLQIGAEYENSVVSFFFNGKIDDIRIYNRALKDCEIQALYNESQSNIPTLSEWGLIIFGFILLAAGAVFILRRKRIATT